MEDVERGPAMQASNSSCKGQDLVGKRIQVWWKQEKQWYRGKITGFNATGKHYITYDDGDKEWVDLNLEQWELLAKEGEVTFVYKLLKKVTCNARHSDCFGDLWKCHE